MATKPVPAHLAPENCYVCGHPPHADNAPAGHNFWSNADARAYFRNEDAQTVLTRSPEAAYVAQHRPY